ncbi:MAG: hypothetical protein B6I35_01400 [Anaerolineaceae bacterium 4572_32.2]|nr:MAG: hypothetical protein B6I35_01400 [Anaerolineaceae bacterium 4572_32.2]HEY72068.1 hypothetical protein [Thermoflexia bacterium]
MDETTKNRNGAWNRLKVFVGLAALVFAVTLAVVIGNRLSDEALAVLAGAVCGVGAAIPTSLLIVAVSRKRDGETKEQARIAMPPQGAYPPVIVVAPPGGQQRANGWNMLPPSLSAPMQRNFTVVGGTPVDMGGNPYGHYS